MIDFSARRKLLARLTRQDGPALYRRLYGMPAPAPPLEISLPEDWQRLPLLSKEFLEAIPSEERIFLPRHAIDTVRASSGTSGKPPLFSPQTSMSGPYYQLSYHPEARAFLTSVPPPHLAEVFLEAADRPPLVVALDPQNIPGSVALARAVGVDSVFVHAFLMPGLGEELKRQQYAPAIRYVELVGEPSPPSLVAYVRATLPGATVVAAYGATEVEGAIGTPCCELRQEPPFEIYHEGPGIHLELLDEFGSSRAPTPGAEGELVVTAYAGEPFALPLVRYQIGDIARVVEADCPRHGAWSFTILGRKDGDFLRIPGGMLRADEIERVLRNHPGVDPERFELQLRWDETATEPHIETVLYLTAPPQTKWDTLAHSIAGALRVGPQATYADGVERGVYRPLRCMPMPVSATPGKQKRLRRIE
jgi:phenylacetate-coenzyme A ligase PaaK-like adenylate-forming protein